jgi:hypothetical protein
MYRAIQVKGNPKPQTNVTSMATKGENLRDLPQFLKPEFAQSIKNYYSLADGRLIKRKGLSRIFNIDSTGAGTLLEKFTDNVYIFGYDTTTSAYFKNTETILTIKSDWVGTIQCGARYGEYFFACDGVGKIHRIQTELNYDGETSNFTLGATLTGTTSGATAKILQITDAGTTGTLVLELIGTTLFDDNEPITDSEGGAAVANGVLTYEAIEVADSPEGVTYLRAIGTRLYAAVGNAVYYSDIDDGTNPPFLDWTPALNADDPGVVYSRVAGNVNSIEGLGENIVVFAENGKYAFTTTVQDVGGTLSKIDTFQISRVDFGGARGAITTPKGLFYFNEAGLWQLASLGQSNIPFSDQEFEVTQILGQTYFQDVDLANISIVYDAQRELLLVSMAKDSASNNQVLCYNFQTQGISFFTGWFINRFMTDDTEIYAISAKSARGWKVFEGFSDDGNDIQTDFEQELTLGGLWTRQILQKMYVQGFLSPSTEIQIRLSIYDVNGVFVPDKLVYSWTPSTGGGSGEGYDQLPYNESYGGDLDVSGLIEDFNGIRPWIRNFQRVKLRLTCSDQLNHQINWISLQATPKVDIRKRKLTKI